MHTATAVWEPPIELLHLSSQIAHLRAGVFVLQTAVGVVFFRAAVPSCTFVEKGSRSELPTTFCLVP